MPEATEYSIYQPVFLSSLTSTPTPNFFCVGGLIHSDPRWVTMLSSRLLLLLKLIPHHPVLTLRRSRHRLTWRLRRQAIRRGMAAWVQHRFRSRRRAVAMDSGRDAVPPCVAAGFWMCASEDSRIYRDLYFSWCSYHLCVLSLCWVWHLVWEFAMSVRLGCSCSANFTDWSFSYFQESFKPYDCSVLATRNYWNSKKKERKKERHFCAGWMLGAEAP